MPKPRGRTTKTRQATGQTTARRIGIMVSGEERQEAIAEAFADLGEVVYFMRVSGLIKIGTTRNLKDRHRKYGDLWLTDILAVIPGGRDLERQMLDRFARSLAHDREWFHPTPDLIEYINSLRAKAGVEAIT